MKTSTAYIFLLLVLLFCLSYCSSAKEERPEVQMPDASFQLNNLEDKKKEKDLVLSKDENENSGPENAGIFVIY